MAKIVVTFEDKSNGKVSIKCNPPLEKIAKDMIKGRREMTAAEAYVMKAMNECREASRRLDRLEGDGPRIITPGPDGKFR